MMSLPTPLPSSADNLWRYFPLEKTLLPLLTVDQAGTSPAHSSEHILAKISALLNESSLGRLRARVVFHNGRLLSSLSFAHADNHVALQEAASGEVHLSIQSALCGEYAIDVVHCYSLQDRPETDHAPQLHIHVATGAQAVVLERLVSVGDNISSAKVGSTHVTALNLAADAHLTHAVVQDFAQDHTHYHRVTAKVDDHAHYHCAWLQVGAHAHRCELQCDLTGAHAASTLCGFHLSHRHLHDAAVVVQHLGQHTQSMQKFWSVANHQGKSSFTGKIAIQPAATHSKAKQYSRGLLLSSLAKINFQPLLAILTDEVACAHGATVGCLDDDAVFYLQSRGFSETEARQMLTDAFVCEFLEQVQEYPSWLYAYLCMLIQKNLTIAMAAA
jgi:Fe-S cluster assembly scaffold protein SufB